MFTRPLHAPESLVAPPGMWKARGIVQGLGPGRLGARRLGEEPSNSGDQIPRPECRHVCEGLQTLERGMRDVCTNDLNVLRGLAHDNNTAW